MSDKRTKKKLKKFAAFTVKYSNPDYSALNTVELDNIINLLYMDMIEYHDNRISSDLDSVYYHFADKKIVRKFHIYERIQYIFISCCVLLIFFGVIYLIMQPLNDYAIKHTPLLYTATPVTPTPD